MSEWITDRLPPIGKEVLLAWPLPSAVRPIMQTTGAIIDIQPKQMMFTPLIGASFALNTDKFIAWKPLDPPTKFARWSAEVVVKMEEVE